MKKRLVWISVVVLLVAGLVMIRMKRMHERNSAARATVYTPVVRTDVVRMETIPRVRHVTGIVRGAVEADISARIMAAVLSVAAREGDAVQAGEILIRLDARELEDAVQSAESAVVAARQSVAAAETAWDAQHAATARDRTLFGAEAISREQWDRSRAAEAAALSALEAARARLETAKRHLSQARTRLGYAVLTAPFDGIVARRLADPGMLAVPGKPLLTVVDNTAVRIRARIPAPELPFLSVGAPVHCRTDVSETDAVVSRIFPAMDDAHLPIFEVDLDDPPEGFVSGAHVALDVTLQAVTGLTVPRDAVLEGESAVWVFPVRNGVVQPVAVTLREDAGERVVIDGGVQAGEPVVTGSPARLMTLSEGMAVTPAEREAS